MVTDPLVIIPNFALMSPRAFSIYCPFNCPYSETQLGSIHLDTAFGPIPRPHGEMVICAHLY